MLLVSGLVWWRYVTCKWFGLVEICHVLVVWCGGDMSRVSGLVWWRYFKCKWFAVARRLPAGKFALYIALSDTNRPLTVDY